MNPYEQNPEADHLSRLDTVRVLKGVIDLWGAGNDDEALTLVSQLHDRLLCEMHVSEREAIANVAGYDIVTQ